MQKELKQQAHSAQQRKRSRRKTRMLALDRACIAVKVNIAKNQYLTEKKERSKSILQDRHTKIEKLKQLLNITESYTLEKLQKLQLSQLQKNKQ